MIIRTSENTEKLEQVNENYSLSVQAELNGFSFCVSDIENGELLLLEEHTFNTNTPTGYVMELKEAIDKSLLWKRYPCKNVHISIFTPQSLLFPSNIATEVSITSLHHLVFNENKYGLVREAPLKQYNARLIYSIDAVVYDFFHQLFPLVHIHHQFETLLHAYELTYGVYDLSKTVFINFNKNNVQLVRKENNNLRFINSFEFKMPEDALYYILASIEHLEFKAAATELIVSGNIDKDSQIITLLNKYFSKISFAEANISEAQSAILKDLEKHKYFNLLNTLKCE